MPAPHKTTRAEQVQRNDELIAAALLQQINTVGWDALTVSGVAKAAGVTVGAIYARAENLAELANTVWETRLRDQVEGGLGAYLKAIEASDADGVFAAAQHFTGNRVDMAAAIELAIASLFDDELSEVIGQSFTDILKRLTGLAEVAQLTRHQSAVLVLSTGLLLGNILASADSRSGTELSPEEASLLVEYWHAQPEDLPQENPEEIAFVKPSVGTDSELNLDKIIGVVGKWGYRRATVARMARAVGTTPGSLFYGNASKAGLIARAAESRLYSPLEVWNQYAQIFEERGSAMARAEFLRVYLNPEHEQAWRVNLELARVAKSVPELVRYKTPHDVLQRTHLAMLLLASFLPGIDTLPYLGPFRVGNATGDN